MTPGNVTFWQLISNRGLRKNKKRDFYEGESVRENKKTKKNWKQEEYWGKHLAGTDQTRSVLISFISLKLFLFLGNPAWFYSLSPEPTTAMAILQKVHTIQATAALSRLHRTVCAFYFIFSLTGEIEFMMAESAAWRSNNLGCLAITCPCKSASPVRTEQKISRLDKII